MDVTQGANRHPRASLLFAHRVAGPERALGENLRAQAPAMAQALDDRLCDEPLEMAARLAQPNATDLHLADPELLPHQMIQRHAPGHQGAAAPRGRQETPPPAGVGGGG